MNTIKATPKFSFAACPSCSEETPVIGGLYATHGRVGQPACSASGQSA